MRNNINIAYLLIFDCKNDEPQKNKHYYYRLYICRPSWLKQLLWLTKKQKSLSSSFFCRTSKHKNRRDAFNGYTHTHTYTCIVVVHVSTPKETETQFSYTGGQQQKKCFFAKSHPVKETVQTLFLQRFVSSHSTRERESVCVRERAQLQVCVAYQAYSCCCNPRVLFRKGA